MSALEQRERNAAHIGSDLTVEDEESLHRLFELVYSEGDLRAAQDLVASDVQGYCSGTVKAYRGVSGLKAHASRLRSVFHGLTVEIDDIRRSSDGFEARVTAMGRFERAFAGVQPPCVIGPAGAEPHGPKVRLDGVVSGTVSEGALRTFEIEWDLEALRDER